MAVKSTGYHPVFGQVADEADDGPAVLSVSEVPPSDAQGDVVVGVKSKSDNGEDDDDEMPERYPGHVLYKVTRYLVNGEFSCCVCVCVCGWMDVRVGVACKLARSCACVCVCVCGGGGGG